MTTWSSCVLLRAQWHVPLVLVIPLFVGRRADRRDGDHATLIGSIAKSAISRGAGACCALGRGSQLPRPTAPDLPETY